MKIGFFGIGNMSSAIAHGIYRNSHLKNVEMYFYTPSKTKAKDLAHELNAHYVEDLNEMPKNLDWYFLGFKPQNLNDFHFDFLKNSKLVSMLAGTSVSSVIEKFPSNKVIRIMPNTPSRILQGMNLVYFDSDLLENDQNDFINIMNSCGEIEVVKSEEELDLLTPFSGSGPGIIFEFAQYFEESLKELVGNDVDSKKIIAQTFYGSAALMKESDLSFTELRDQVTSKKGVTFSALEEMRNKKISNAMNSAFEKAILRINEMKRGV